MALAMNTPLTQGAAWCRSSFEETDHMKLRIVNLFALFQNSYNEAGWVVYRAHDLVARFRTRAEARQFVADADRSGRS